MSSNKYQPTADSPHTFIFSSHFFSNMAGAFTLAFSYYAGLEGITYGKVLGIIACFLGAVCVGLNDTGDGNGQMQTVTGDIVAFFGAVGYGLYTTIIRYKVSFNAETVFYFWFHFQKQ